MVEKIVELVKKKALSGIDSTRKIVKISNYWFQTILPAPGSAKCSSARLLHLLLFSSFRVVPYGLAVRIPGFHPGGPGSTPGMGIRNLFCSSSDIVGCFDDT